VLFNGRDAPPSITKARLQTLVELKLRTAGLRVLSVAEDAKDPDVNPTVVLDLALVSVKDSDDGGALGYAFSTRLSVFERHGRNKAPVRLELWSSAQLKTTNPDSAASVMERVVNGLLDELVNAWLKDNPKP
jgi:hypothetical protein